MPIEQVLREPFYIGSQLRMGSRVRVFLSDPFEHGLEHFIDHALGVCESPRPAFFVQVSTCDLRVGVPPGDREGQLTVIMLMGLGNDVIRGSERHAAVLEVKHGDFLRVHVQVPDRHCQHHCPEQSLDILLPRVLQEHPSDSPQTDLAAKPLTLLIAACSKRLVEVLLVQPSLWGGGGTVVAFDYERRYVGELLKPRSVRRQSDGTSQAGSVLLIVDDGGEARRCDSSAGSLGSPGTSGSQICSAPATSRP